jgi:hypothetical protein
MVIKATLFTLIIILFTVVGLSYYVNKEGFDDISNSYVNSISKEFDSAVNTITPPVISNNVQQEQEQTTTTPTRTDVVPEVKISGSGYDAMSLQQRMDLLKDIQKVVRNEILASRNTKPILSGETEHTADTNSTAQGKEYENSCHKETEYRCPKNPDGTCPPLPDMSQYIKKDAIPCWGCAIDY